MNIKSMILTLALMAGAACQTLESAITSLQAAEAECKAKGGAYVLARGCKTDVPAPEPQPEPGPGPGPEPEPPAPGPEPAPTPVGGYAEGEFTTITPPAGPIHGGDIRFTLTGLDSRAFHDRDAWLFMLMGRADSGAEYNLQLHVYRDGHDSQIRLISQRHDGFCSPRPLCEGGDGIPGIVTDVSKSYTVRIQWPFYSAELKRDVFRMDISDIGVWEIPYTGDFQDIEFIRIGNGVFRHRGDWPGQEAPLTVSNVVATWS